MYEAIDSEISRLAVIAFKRHQWYLTPELVTLSLFDEETSCEEKGAIDKRLHQYKIPKQFDKGKPKFDDVKDLVFCITEQSWFLFSSASAFLSLNDGTAPTYSQLEKSPNTWSECQEFLRLAVWVKEIPVTNDAAERGVKNALEVKASASSAFNREKI